MANTLPKIALGAWAWGNDGTFGGNMTAETLRPIFDTAMANGLNLWDTAYAYGMGTSEKVLAGFLKDLPRESYLVSDKFTPQCANGKPTAMADMIEMQLDLMGLDRFCAYNSSLNSRHLKSALLAVAWNADDWTFEALTAHYRTLVRYINFADMGMVLGHGCGTPSMTARSKYPREAYQLGASL